MGQRYVLYMSTREPMHLQPTARRSAGAGADAGVDAGGAGTCAAAAAAAHQFCFPCPDTAPFVGFSHRHDLASASHRTPFSSYHACIPSPLPFTIDPLV